MNNYSLWRYILLGILILLGLLYSAPMIYGEDYAVQISGKDTQTISTSVTERVATLLTAQKIPYKSIALNPEDAVVRFNSDSDQAKAQNILEAGLSQYGDFAVALNLAPRTPEWLQKIGATPMKLGLDLRGGIHFLLKVKVNQLVDETLKSDVRTMAEKLRASVLRYSSIRRVSDDSINMTFKDESVRDKALVEIKKDYSSYTFRTYDKAGVYGITAQMQPSDVIKIQQSAVTQNINILRTRVDALGISQPVINQQGKDQISVDLPGVQDMAQAKSLIGTMATIRLQLEDIDHDPSEAQQSGVVPFGSTLYTFEGRPILIKNQVILQGKDILSATSGMGDDGYPSVNLSVGGSSVSSFNRITGQNVGKPLAVLYTETKTEKSMVDGKVVSTPKTTERIINVASIQTALGSSFQITHLDSTKYANDLALLLRSGAYVAQVEFIAENVVGPTLGKENIRNGALSCAVGSLFVILFMLAYYRLFGIVSSLALLLNVVFVVALMSTLGATLTLPGIAGIVLTVGMAVDANVLINERIREELRNGMTPQASIASGYARAFSTIVDANVTTLLVAVVMYCLGTSDVKGLAVTLILGLLTSMITAIFFTRAIINLIYGNRSVKHLSIGIKVR